MVQLTDSFNRKMDYLRISVTDRCNFRCQYCMPEDIQFQDKSHILTLEEMLTFAEACLALGVTKVRVTGGEPLVRKGVVKFVGWLKDLGFEDVTMTTNGFLLKENLEGLVEAGLDRVNISLDTLQPEKFAFITRRDHFQKVWEAMMAALETPLSPVKINAVAMRGINDDEISDMAKLTLKYPMHVRFIELMPLNGDTDGSRFRSLFISGKEILERAQEELGELTEIEPDDPAAPAGEVKIEGAPGTFGVITPVSEPFCARCSRLPSLTGRRIGTMAGYTIINLKEVEDQAPKFGHSPNLEARFARGPLELENSGISYFRIASNFRIPFGHKHQQQEEIYVLIGGSARAKLGDEVVELKTRSTVRVSPET